MSNITVLQEILNEIDMLTEFATDPYYKCALQANKIKYRKELDKEYERNALDIVEHKLKHLVSKLK